MFLRNIIQATMGGLQLNKTEQQTSSKQKKNTHQQYHSELTKPNSLACIETNLNAEILSLEVVR
jgi:hypothetical protein